MSTQTLTNPDGSTVTVTVPDPIVTVADPVVTVGEPVISWTPPPAPTTVATSGTFFGNTPRSSSNAAGVAAVDQAYGVAGQVIRLYCTGALTAPAATDRKVVGSFKSMATASALRAAAAGYDWLFYQHEIDSKVKKGSFSASQWHSDMATMVGQKLPGLAVCLTADCFVNPGKNPADYLVDGVTHLGVDFDGISSATGYHDYTKELAAVVAFCQKHGLTWGVPEFGANRAGNDPDGSARAAWLTLWAGLFEQAGAEYVCLWEFSTQDGSTFTTPAEIATVRAMLTLGARAPK